MQFLLVIASREPGPHRRPKDQRAGLAGPQDAILCQAIANVCANRPNVLCRHVPRALGHWQPSCGSLEADNLESCPACQLKRPRLVLLGEGRGGALIPASPVFPCWGS